MVGDEPHTIGSDMLSGVVIRMDTDYNKKK